MQPTTSIITEIIRAAIQNSTNSGRNEQADLRTYVTLSWALLNIACQKIPSETVSLGSYSASVQSLLLLMNPLLVWDKEHNFWWAVPLKSNTYHENKSKNYRSSNSSSSTGFWKEIDIPYEPRSESKGFSAWYRTSFPLLPKVTVP